MRVGDLVLCIKQGPWVQTRNGQIIPGPVAGQILPIAGFMSKEPFWLIFEGYPGRYKPDRFVPINDKPKGIEEPRRVVEKAPTLAPA